MHLTREFETVHLTFFFQHQKPLHTMSNSGLWWLSVRKKIKYSLLAIIDNSAVLSSYMDTVHNARSILFRRLNNVWYKVSSFSNWNTIFGGIASSSLNRNFQVNFYNMKKGTLKTVILKLRIKVKEQSEFLKFPTGCLTFSPLSAGRKKPAMVSMESIVQGMMMLNV